MDADSDPLISELDALVTRESVAALVKTHLDRVLQQLAASTGPMAWEVVPLTELGRGLPDAIRSCWIFVIRAGAATGAERHPNSHQRSLSLTGSGRFELLERRAWIGRPLVSGTAERWVTIPPSTWHRLFVGMEAWGLLSFHTVPEKALIEERPVDPENVEGETRQEGYLGREADAQ